MKGNPLPGCVDWPRLGSPHWLAVLLACTLALLLLGGFWVKGPCLDHPWDGFQYERACYTDLIPLYGGRGLDESQVPYVESFNEYPVLTGLWMYLSSLPADDKKSFFIWNAVGLGLMALAVTFVLWRTSEKSVHVLWWALAPPLALYSFHNWDMLAVLLMVLGVHAYLRERALLSGVFLGLGVAAKIFPVFLLPILAAGLVRRAHQSGTGPWWRGLKAPRLWWFALGAAGSWLLVNLPFIVINRGLWWQTYAFHSERGPTIESHWNVIRHYAGRWDHGWVQDIVSPATLPTLSLVLIALGVLALAALVLAGRLPVLHGCLGALCVFLLANQVISIQYMLWIVPFFALLPGLSWPRKLFVFAADILVYLAVFEYFYLRQPGQSQVGFEQLAVASLLRVVAIVVLLVGVVKRPKDSGLDGEMGSGETA